MHNVIISENQKKKKLHAASYFINEDECVLYYYCTIF